MGYEKGGRTFAKTAALAMLLVGPGCGVGAQPGQTGTDNTGTENTGSENTGTANGPEATGTTEEALGKTSTSGDCGVNDTRKCLVTTAFTFGQVFDNLQEAIDAAPDGDVITVQGQCGHGIVSGRFGLTIQGPMAFTCGFTGPTPTQLKGEVRGLQVDDSISISVRFLNLIKSSGDGLAFVGSTTPLASCNCAAFNGANGFNMTDTIAAVLSQNRSEQNHTGILSNRTNTVIISNNTVTLNKANGITVENSTGNNVSFNIVTNNGGKGIFFQNSNNSLATGNTIKGNGDRLTNLISCSNSSVFGSNVPARGCSSGM
jgi:parallel beta-helix repeat protein